MTKGLRHFFYSAVRFTHASTTRNFKAFRASTSHNPASAKHRSRGRASAREEAFWRQRVIS